MRVIVVVTVYPIFFTSFLMSSEVPTGDGGGKKKKKTMNEKRSYWRTLLLFSFFIPIFSYSFIFCSLWSDVSGKENKGVRENLLLVLYVYRRTDEGISSPRFCLWLDWVSWWDLIVCLSLF